MTSTTSHPRRRRATLLAGVAAAMGVAAVVASPSSGGAQGPAASAAATSKTTIAGIKQAKWAKNVTVTFGKGYVRYRSDGLPDHARQKQYALPTGGGVPSAATATAGDDPTKAQSYDFKIPTTPKRAATVTSTSLGTIGVMISGAGLFNPYEGDGTTVATASNFTVKGTDGSDVAFLDACSGHPTPGGIYHYHALPECVTARVDKSGGASHLIGLAFDGYPIYGDRDIKGRKVSASRLDKCNGLTSATPEFPKGIYHYVLLDTTTSRSSIRCFRGTVDASLSTRGGMPGMAGMPPMPGM